MQIRQFSIDQYIDIFQFISKGIQDITRIYYIDVHRSNLPIIISQIKDDNQTHGVNGSVQKDQEFFYQHSENFVRSIIASAFGLQVLDNFVNAIIRTLSAELEKFKDNKQILNLVMAYSPEAAIAPLYKRSKEVDNQILIGNKGYMLKVLTSFNFPVPPGFIITTEVFRGYDAVVAYKYIFKDLSKRIYKEITELERITGKRYGSPRNPLLLSVRSGATYFTWNDGQFFLMWGSMIDSRRACEKRKILLWAAWDSYRRFLQTWGMFMVLERNFFVEIMNSYKRDIPLKRRSIRARPDERNCHIIQKSHEGKRHRDHGYPAEQLQHAILQVLCFLVFRTARINRHQMHLSDEWGTAVIVQSMDSETSMRIPVQVLFLPRSKGSLAKRSYLRVTLSSGFRVMILSRSCGDISYF